jgi:hypothetical protein
LVSQEHVWTSYRIVFNSLSVGWGASGT